MPKVLQSNFTAGEVSPYIEGQVNLAKYQNALRACLNMIPLPYGPVRRRTGTVFVAEAGNSDYAVRLIPFIFNESEAYVLELGQTTSSTGYMRFFANQGVVVTDAGTTYTIETPYVADDLPPIKHVQSGDTVFMTHPNIWPRTLVRSGHTSWALDTIGFTSLTSTISWTGSTWPAAVNFFEERLVWAGDPGNPQTLYASKSGEYTNMETGTDADDAWLYTIASEFVNNIRWLTPATRLIVGTEGTEWTAGAQSILDPITPTNVKFDRQSSHGTANIQSKLIHDYLIFVGQHGKKVWRYGYDWTKDGYKGQELTILSEHITGDGITAFDYAQDPDSLIYFVRDDGALITCTYMPNEEVIGWARHTTGLDGEFESVAVIPNPTEKRDEVWCVVKRTVNGTAKRYIEYFTQDWEHGDEVEDGIFLDSSLTYDGCIAISSLNTSNPVKITTTSTHGWSSGDELLAKFIEGTTELNNRKFTASTAGCADNEVKLSGIDGTSYSAYEEGGVVCKTATTISGLDHLEGETVGVLTDGATHPNRTVSSGAITLQHSAGKVHVGIGYSSYIETLRPELQTRDGTIQGSKLKVRRAGVLFHRTAAAKVGVDNDTLFSLPFRDPSMAMDAPVEPYSGWKVSALISGSNRDGRVWVLQDKPLPMAVLGIMRDLEIGEP